MRPSKITLVLLSAVNQCSVVYLSIATKKAKAGRRVVHQVSNSLNDVHTLVLGFSVR